MLSLVFSSAQTPAKPEAPYEIDEALTYFLPSASIKKSPPVIWLVGSLSTIAWVVIGIEPLNSAVLSRSPTFAK